MASREEAEEALRRLEERLDRASDAAERLLSEAASRAGSSSEADARPGSSSEPGSRAGSSSEAGARAGPPPAGWQAPGGERAERGDLELLLQVFHSLRDLIPPELQRRLADALRELLLALRALIDWYLERSEQRRAEPTEVQDIPIL